ncbi:MAG: AAA family ATPase [Treponema sp.]|jgi:AAA+ superfamily predicted ATPase|nr:AAA family ATPase [Treponema sp.]
MLFYKIDVELSGKAEEPEKSECRDRATALQAKIGMLFEKCEYSCHITIADIIDKKSRAELCAAVKAGMMTASILEDFLRVMDLEYHSFTFQEITFKAYFDLLRLSCQLGYISSYDAVVRKLKIDGLARHGHSGLPFSEAMILGDNTRRELLARAAKLLCENLPVEIERIYQGSKDEKSSGHPVHYLLQSDALDLRNKMLRVLLRALYQNGRIASRRYCEVKFVPTDYLSASGLKALYESCGGGTVVVSFAEDEQEESDHARIGADVIAELCSVMRAYRNRVLTVFCLPKSADKIKEVFLEHLGAITLVPLAEDTAFGPRAKNYLRSLAGQHGTKPDKALYKPIAEGKGYSAGDLQLIFDEWYDHRLKTTVFTQYADLETANKQVALKKPRGSAFEELENMIGLAEVKKIIRQCLNFYKAQKLFREKGISTERPAMHMIFTGHPGTAKTTVARLLAQIMKDNDLLSVGDLYEVGRADLVGKYVGWTAPLVQKKFKAAKGSVLFIDEAYSLVERDGEFGDEAINTIVQEMENHREDMVVIFAGYPDKMDGFLQKNPGLLSRIAFQVPFADYDAAELCSITRLLADKKKLSLAADVEEKLHPIFAQALQKEDFGNGRFARNLLEKAVMKQAGRLVAMEVDLVTRADVSRLLAEDFDAPEIMGK